MTRECRLCRCQLPIAQFLRGSRSTNYCPACRKIRDATAKRLQYKGSAEVRKKKRAANQARYYRDHEKSKAMSRAQYAKHRERKLLAARRYDLRKAREHFQTYGHQLLRVRNGSGCRTCASEYIGKHYGRRAA